MASSWADEMTEEAGMPALNFTALLDDAQAAARNGLSSGDEETAATPGQRREGSRGRAADRAVDRPPDIWMASPAAATSASTRQALQPRERQFDQRGAPLSQFIARPDPRPVTPTLVEVQQPGQPPHAWPVEHGIRVANGLHDITAIMQGGNERPIELDWRQEECALPRAPAHTHGFPLPPAHDRPYAPYVAPGWPAGQRPNAQQVHLVDQHFVPEAFLLELQGVIRNIVALGVDPRPTPAQRFEVKERFAGLITDGAGQQALLDQHLESVLRQLIANQMFGLQTYQMLAAGVFIKSTLCSEVASLFSSLFDTRRKRGLLDGFPVLLALWIWWTPTATQDQHLPCNGRRTTSRRGLTVVPVWRWLRNSSSTSLRANDSSSKKRVMSWTRHINTWPLVLKSTPSSSESQHQHGWWSSTTRCHQGRSTTTRPIGGGTSASSQTTPSATWA